jgi:BMFP domain-containing protein YqiC
MPKKKPARRKSATGPLLARLQGGLKKMQRDAEGLLSRARKEAVRLSREQKQAVDRVISQAKRLRTDFEKSVKQTSKDLESRSKRLLSALEKDIEKRIEPAVRQLVERLDLPSRREVQNLSQRFHALEAQVQQHSHAETPEAPGQQTPSEPSDVV